MNPRNGEIYACVNVPEFDLNDPFTLNTEETEGTSSDGKKKAGSSEPDVEKSLSE